MTIEGERWAPGIGDPTIVGWVTVLAYFMCALLCFAASKRRHYVVIKREDVDVNPKIFWVWLGLLLIALAINKQLDLQSLFTQVGRDLAIQQGWYESRKTVQLVFISALGILGVSIVLLATVVLWHSNKMVKLALVGFAILFIFVLTRATSFHAIDQFLGFNFGWVKLNWIMELGGIGIIIIAALVALIHRPKRNY